MGGDRLAALAAITLALCLLGIAGAVVAGARRGAAVAGLGLMFACGALRQGFMLYGGSVPAWDFGAAALGELCLLGVAFGGLVALRALQRTTGERDRAEDLHWDSMETVRVMSELAARPGADLGGKLGTVLELGATRFGLEVGIAWRENDVGAGEVIALRASGQNEHPDALVERLLPRLRDAAKSTRPVLLIDREREPRVLFGAPIHLAGDAHGTLAFAGSSALQQRITATDKDLMGLMAQWLAVELDRQERATTESARPPVRGPDPLRPRLARRSLDLNDAVRRVEPRLRRRVGADATLELDLGTNLGRARSTRLSLPSLVESLVIAAARLATGRIQVATRRVGDTTGSGDLSLCVSVAGDDIDANAFDLIFAEPKEIDAASDQALPLARLERLLQREGGDLSVTVEPRRRAVITAYLPAVSPRGRSYAAADL